MICLELEAMVSRMVSRESLKMAAKLACAIFILEKGFYHGWVDSVPKMWQAGTVTGNNTSKVIKKNRLEKSGTTIHVYWGNMSIIDGCWRISLLKLQMKRPRSK
jgi:hypothetical protein